VSESPVCVFDLDHTLVSSPLDLIAAAREMEAFVRGNGVVLPAREHRWSAAELYDLVRREAAHLEADAIAIPVAHERRAMEHATLEPFDRCVVNSSPWRSTLATVQPVRMVMPCFSISLRT